jgi:hypothetical protein
LLTLPMSLILVMQALPVMHTWPGVVVTGDAPLEHLIVRQSF